MSGTRFFVLCSHIHFMYKYADDKILLSNLCLSNLGFCEHFTKRRLVLTLNSVSNRLNQIHLTNCSFNHTSVRARKR